MQTPEDDGHRRVDLVEAIAWWRTGGVDGRASLTRAASRALLGDANSSALAELAGVPADENPFVIDGLVERVVDELALGDELAVDVELLAARRPCRALLAEKTTERELTRWVHQRFGHASTSELLNRLAELDDDFDVAGGGGKSGTAAIAERVRAVARRIVAGS